MVQQSVKIEDAWNEVRATYNATPAEIERLIAPTGNLGKAVTDLSLKYGLARDEVIELLAKLSQMGYTGKDATDTLRQGLEFAVAAGLKLEDGLNLSVAIVNTFGLKGQQLTDTLRGLNVVENETAASGFDLMKALTRAGGAAEAMVGPSFTSKDAVASLAAGMAVLKANGQETARSADALRAIFQRMYTPTKQVQFFLDKMGVSLKTAKGEIVPFPELLQNLADNFDKLTPYERMQFGKKLIGVEFGPLFQTLIKDVQKADSGLSIYNNTLDEFGDTAKGAKAYAHELEVRQDSLRVALGQVRAAFGLLVDVMRPALTSVIKPIAGAIAAAGRAMAGASPQAQKMAVIIGLVVAVAGPLILIIGALIAAISTIGGPILLVVAGIGALVAAFTAVIQRGGPLADFVKGALGTAWGFVKDGVSDLMDALKALTPYFKVVGALLGGSILGILVVLGAAFKVLAAIIKWLAETIIGPIFQFIIDAAMWLYDVLVGHSIIPDLINAIVFWFNLLWTLIGPIIETFVNLIVIAFQTLVSIVTNVVTTFIAVLTAAWNILWTVITSIVNIIVTTVVAAFNILVATGTFLWNTLVTAITLAINVILAVVTFVINQVVTVLKFAWDIIVATATFVWNNIKVIIQTVMGVIQGIVKTVMSLIKGDWKGAWEGIQQIGSSIWNGIKGLWQNFLNFMKSIGQAALNFIKSTWSNIWNAIKSIGSSIWNAIKSLWNSFWSTMKSIGSSALNVIKSVINGVINTIKSIISNGIKAALAVWRGTWNTFKSIVSGIASGIKAIINGVIKAVSGLVGKVKGAVNKIKGIGSGIKNVLGFSQGGLVPGRGTGDTVPAMLTPGEFVVTKRAVRRIGVANLVRMNRNYGGAAALGTEAETTGSTAVTPPQTARSLAAKAATRIEVARAGTRVDSGDVSTSVLDNLKAAAGASREVSYNFTTAVYNPVAEKASDSVQRRVTRLADMGMFASAGKDGS